MTPLVAKLAALAFHRAAPADANRAIADARAMRAVDGPPVSFEVALPALDADDFLVRRTLPRLVYFLDCRGMTLPATPGVFVSLFTPEGLFFVDAGLAAVTIGGHAGLEAEELVRRYGESGAGNPLLLGA